MSSRLYRFDDFEADEARFELRRAGARVELQPKALDFLFHLLRHRDRVVSKEELVGRLWPDAVVTDASLSKAASRARRALGDRGRTPVYVETLWGRGFRFLAPVEEKPAPPWRDDGQGGDPGLVARLRADTAAGFVGREQVLVAIVTAVAAASKAGRLILLSGEAGMGKTSTALEAAARVLDARVLMSWCPEGGGAPALWPWIRLLREVLAEPDVVPLTARLGDGLADLAPFLPALQVPASERRRSRELEPEQARFRLFATATELLMRASHRVPCLVVLDDFHLADPGSLAMLGFVARELADSRLAVLVTYRGEDLPAGHPLLELSRRPDCVALSLTGLERDEVRRLLELEAGREVDPSVVEAVHERTEGNPFFVKELGRAFAADRHLDAAAVAKLPLPAGIREALRQRLDRLSAGCRQVLTAGAAIGRDFDVGTVASATGLSPERTLALLDEARRSSVIRHVDGKQRLSHALVREALLERIGEVERAALHRRIGEALEMQHGPDDDSRLGELAFHFCAGAVCGMAEKGIAYARRAGDRAAALLAYDEAAEHYRRALDIEPLVAADRRRTCDLLLALGEAQIASGRPGEGRETLRKVASIARSLGLGEHLARAALASGGLLLSTEPGIDDPELVGLLEEALDALPDGDSALRVSILIRLAIALTWSATPTRAAQDLIRRGVESARRLADPVALGHALYVHRWSLLRLDHDLRELEARLADADEILRLGRLARHRGLELAGRSCRFLDLIEAGRVPEADRELAAYERLAANLRVPRYRWRTGMYRAMRTLMEGRLDDAEVVAQATFAEEHRFAPADAGSVFGVQLTTVRREQGRIAELEPAIAGFAERFPGIPAWRAALALCRAELGREADARDGFETLAADDFRAVRGDPMRIATLVVLAETCALLSDVHRANTLYDLLRPYAPRLVVIGAGTACWGAVDRHLGLLALTSGDWQRAARHFEEGLEMDRRAGARLWGAWDEYELARVLALCGRRRDRERAREHLVRAQQTANALGIVRLRRRAAELAPRLEVQAHRSRGVGLVDRE